MAKKIFLIVVAASLLAACGKDLEWLPDGTKPKAFSFTSQTNVEPNKTSTTTYIESESITISGNIYPATISVTNGEYAISGATTSTTSTTSTSSSSSGSYTSAIGTISAGQQVKVRHPTPSTYSTQTVTTLHISSVSGTFTSVTKAAPFTNISSVTTNPIATDASGAIKLYSLTAVETFRDSTTVNYNLKYQVKNTGSSQKSITIQARGQDSQSNVIASVDFPVTIDAGQTINSISPGSPMAISTFDSIKKWVAAQPITVN
jgi:hypothetical protein